MDDPGGPAAYRPVRLSMVDLLSVADAIPLLDQLALLVAMRRGGDRETVVFGILDGLRVHLDGTAPDGGTRGGQETSDAIRGWFELRIAEEETRAAGPCAGARGERG